MTGILMADARNHPGLSHINANLHGDRISFQPPGMLTRSVTHDTFPILPWRICGFNLYSDQHGVSLEIRVLCLVSGLLSDFPEAL